jgi:SAM-dependent methyltransferase
MNSESNMNPKELYTVDNLPIFQNKMYSNQNDALNCAKGNIRLVQDLNTGLIFNCDFNPNLMLYDKDYQNEQAHSKIFKDHLNNVKSIIDRCFKTKEFIEVGCGKGYFLEYMNQFGYNTTGYDPTYEGNNENIIKEYFDPSSKKISSGVVLRHVLEHVKDPLDFLKSVADSNKNQGLIYIEVPCFDWICEHKAWFDIFYEHVNYFRLTDFHRMFEHVIESGNIFGGQYLYVVADMATLKNPKLNNPHESFNFRYDFLNTLYKTIKIAKIQRNVIWGGASKGVIFSLYLQRAGIDIEYIIDINPAKQNKFTGASGIKIFSPEDVMPNLKYGQNIFVMNSNYLQEIKDITNNQFNYIKVD